jgi:hypothetical protein
VAGNSVGTAEVDGSLTGADIANAPGGSDDVDADRLDGTSIADLASRSDSSGSTVPGFVTGMRFFAYFMNTGASSTFEFGSIEIRSPGTAGVFRVCSNDSTPQPFVLYLNGTRTTPTAQANNACSTNIDVGAADGDFMISGANALIHGISPSGTDENYRLFGWGAF